MCPETNKSMMTSTTCTKNVYLALLIKNSFERLRAFKETAERTFKSNLNKKSPQFNFLTSIVIVCWCSLADDAPKPSLLLSAPINYKLEVSDRLIKI